MTTARLARASDLAPLLALFEVSEVSAAAQPLERAESIWRETLAQAGVFVFVSDDGLRIAAVQVAVDGIGQAQALDEEVEGAEAAAVQAVGLVAQFVVDVAVAEQPPAPTEKIGET